MPTFVVRTEIELRDALEAASASGKSSKIVFHRHFGDQGTQELTDVSLEYTGSQDLTIIGNGVTLTQGNTQVNIFESTGGGNLTINNLNLSGGDSGIYVETPSGQGGTVTANLRRTTITGSRFHGLWVKDNTDASVEVNLHRSLIENNGAVGDEGYFVPDEDNIDPDDSSTGIYGVPLDTHKSPSDADGVRVDETGAGDIFFTSKGSQFLNNGGDGVELDESDAGGVFFDIKNSMFEGNGRWDGSSEIDPADTGDTTTYADLEDGFDIDEAGIGSISGRARNSTFNDNFDEGFDLDEAGYGNVEVDFSNVEVNGNTDEGFKVTEEDAGDVITGISNSMFSSNGGRGIELEEEGGDSIILNGRNVSTQANDGDGVRLASDGTVIATFNNLNSQGNDGNGIDIRGFDGTDPVGTLTLRNSFFDNTESPIAVPPGFDVIGF